MLAAGVLAGALSLHSVAQTASQGGKALRSSNAYIVQLAEMPATAYAGGISGYAATRPQPGQKIDPEAPAVRRYVDYLAARQDAVLASVGGGRKLYNYGYAFNGFAAELTEAQALKLAQRRDVIAVTRNELRRPDTSSTPAFLGLSGTGGVWETKAKGEGVVIGIIDTGVWPEHPSFSDRVGGNGNYSKDGKLGYLQLRGWRGRCVPGQDFTANHCNQKLIGAQYFNAGFGGNAGVAAEFPFEFNSPRDADGHGTHTASTAGGNAGVPATGAAAVFGAISGIAPRARLSVYKVCWGGDLGGCYNVDSVAAIDRAVADGVDVLNFSISGTSTNFLDPVEVAFMFAADAGVFVAASAGNSGPAASTVAHPSPWITTVAAGTHNRDGRGSVTLGNGQTYLGASAAAAVGPAPLIDATAAGLPGANPAALALCYGADDGAVVLDPAKVVGKIVVCDRGVTARTSKSLAVQQAGGVGMILANTSANSLNADLHWVPTVHVAQADRAAVKAYAATPGATAQIGAATLVYDAQAPLTASFSSRGPLLAAGGDLLKPDLIAPGQDILAAVSPPGSNGRLFDILSGTSMSSPHVAGLAALFKELRPGWSPMAIKSALMTTAGNVQDGPDTNPQVIFSQGAGHVRPNAAADPGLVFDSGLNHWLAFLCGTRQLTASYCPSIARDPSDLNVASIAIGDLPGRQAVRRRVTNVGGNPAIYSFSISGLSGYSVQLPGPMTLAAGESRDFELSFTRTGAPLNAYTGGQLTLSDGTHTVRLPVVLRPIAFGAPAQVSGSYSVSFGYDGSFSATPRGLVPAVVTPGTVTQDPDQSFDPYDSSGTVAVQVEIPSGTTYARFSLFGGDAAPGSDIDLVVYRGLNMVGSSGLAGSDEEVSLVDPPAGTYTVFVHGWSVPLAGSPFKLHTWLLGNSAAGNMEVSAPSSAVIGTTGTVNLSFSGLAAGTKYLGSVVYGGAAGLPVPTIVRKDMP